MKDFLNRELNIGDHVICIEPGCKNYIMAEIFAFTPKFVRVKWGENKYEQQLQYPRQLIKIAETDVTWYYLNKK